MSGDGEEQHRAQSLNLLQDRSPAERMERHLPLSVLKLPAVSLQQVQRADRQQKAAARSSSLAERPVPRLSGGAGPSGSASQHTSSQGESEVLRSTGVSGPSFSIQASVLSRSGSGFRGKKDVGEPLPAALSRCRSSASLLPPTSSSPEALRDLVTVSTSPPASRRFTERSLQLPGPPLSSQQSPPGGLFKSRQGDGLDEPSRPSPRHQAAKPYAPSKGAPDFKGKGVSGFLSSRQKLGGTESRQSLSGMSAAGLKLSTRNVVRDSRSGAIAPRVFEAPSTSDEPSVVGLASLLAGGPAGAAATALPDIPGGA